MSKKSRVGCLAGAMLAVTGCSMEEPAPPQRPSVQATHAAATQDPDTTALSALPFVDGLSATRVYVQQLPKATVLGETTAVHVKLPPPTNPELKDSLVRVVGDANNPVVLFRSDTLASMGLVPKSPGPDFFTSFSTLPTSELDRRAQSEQDIASGKFGEISTESILFQGRHPTSRTDGLAVDARAFLGGALTPLAVCPARPASSAAAWGKSLVINDPAVVLNPARTWDPCTGAGTKGGVWTFSHLMREMANGSGKTPEDFVKDWLTLWVNDYTVNSDNVLKRTNMFSQVIQPWATASGRTSALLFNSTTGKNDVLLSGPLDLDIAPFRLLAIVNRLDLAQSTLGGYGGSTAGELRFVFGVTKPSPWGAGTQESCNLKPFTTIFEYGVPRSGCASVINWAQQWTNLNTFPTFNAAYLAQLQTMSESVVKHGMAPSKGNQNAINQIRTNEIALGTQWELREFTLTIENPLGNTNVPASGELRPHTVALTPNDATHNSNTDPDVSSFITGSSITVGSPLVVPVQCSATYSVPFFYGAGPFRGGNSLIAPNFWKAVNAQPIPHDICARHQFSLNTCNGCHFGDSGNTGGTNLAFTHISPTSGIPATLSKFLTGGGVGFSFGVPDTQFGPSVIWQYADLERRYQNLYDIATCRTCNSVFTFSPAFLTQMERVAGAVPFDPAIQPDKTPFRVGPITDPNVVQQLLDLRPQFKGDTLDEPVDFLQPADISVH